MVSTKNMERRILVLERSQHKNGCMPPAVVAASARGQAQPLLTLEQGLLQRPLGRRQVNLHTQVRLTLVICKMS